MKNGKTWVSLILCLMLCVVSLTLDVNASGGEYQVGDTIDGSLLTTDTSAEAIAQHLTRGTYLSNGSSYLQNCGNGVLFISGETNCYRLSSSIQVTLFVERLVNGNWESVSQHTYTNSNDYKVSGGYYLTVSKGYYYRVVGSHSASANGVYESSTSRTNGIWVG